MAYFYPKTALKRSLSWNWLLKPFDVHPIIVIKETEHHVYYLSLRTYQQKNKLSLDENRSTLINVKNHLLMTADLTTIYKINKELFYKNVNQSQSTYVGFDLNLIKKTINKENYAIVYVNTKLKPNYETYSFHYLKTQLRIEKIKNNIQTDNDVIRFKPHIFKPYAFKVQKPINQLFK